MSLFSQPHHMLAVNFDRILLLNVYSNSFIFGTQYKGCLVLTLSHSAREEVVLVSLYRWRNGEVTHLRLHSLLALLLERWLSAKLSLRMVLLWKEFTFSVGKQHSSDQTCLEYPFQVPHLHTNQFHPQISDTANAVMLLVFVFFQSSFLSIITCPTCLLALYLLREKVHCRGGVAARCECWRGASGDRAAWPGSLGAMLGKTSCFLILGFTNKGMISEVQCVSSHQLFFENHVPSLRQWKVKQVSLNDWINCRI